MDEIQNWLATTSYKDADITVASADASFRKYYRLTLENKTFLLMDASLEKSSLQPFLDVTQRLRKAGVNAPKVLEQNIELGYLIIEDFGSLHYLDLLNEENFQELYRDAMREILKMQRADASKLPLYDEKFLLFEMGLMEEWYIQGLLNKELTTKQKETIETTLHTIANVVLEQPQGYFVHRDYHSRNIMRTKEKTIGVIDYQDAMSGAITYDLVSLLKDCYVSFDADAINSLALEFKTTAGVDASDTEFLRWFDFMGMQRHIKVLGVFARLHLRDGKDGYLKDIPLVLDYTLKAAHKYQETKQLAQLLEELTCEQ